MSSEREPDMSEDEGPNDLILTEEQEENSAGDDEEEEEEEGEEGDEEEGDEEGDEDAGGSEEEIEISEDSDEKSTEDSEYESDMPFDPEADLSERYGRHVRQAARPQGLFPHPLDGLESYRNTMPYREQYLRAFSATVREKLDWTEKIKDRSLFVKWVKEANEQDMLASDHAVLTWTPEDIRFSYQELENSYKPFVEAMREKGVPIEPDVDCVWKSDGLIDEELRKQLIDAVATLENVPEEQKDWHPGSNQKVLDLVHPSLWPIVYGRSMSITSQKPIESPLVKDSDPEGYSKKFCWLPSEFEVSTDGTETKIASYINNLSSPEQKTLVYPIIEKIFTKFVPLFNHVLGDLAVKKHQFEKVHADVGHDNWDENMRKLNVEKHEELFDRVLNQFAKSEPMDIDLEAAAEPRKQHYGEEETESEKESLKNDDDNIYYYEVREMGSIRPNAAWEPPKISEEFRLEGKTAKVIVKLANIVLTPEDPVYRGGSWHVEAMLNERIIATGIYYYAQENVTESKLGFRQTLIDIPDYTRVVQYSDWPIVHNMNQDGKAVQRVGSIVTKENRAIAFPNVYQHRVQSFKLADPTKPGYRKILVFFLCDPSGGHDIPTTRTVLPQQPEHSGEFEDALREGPMGKMPEDVFRLIMEELPPPITRAEAEKYRKALMKERASYMGKTAMVKGVSYSL
ncbi:hypothetical protein ABW21_db0205378 [Orbilia brochopaga]|nr:hypothetical protein ABW21_db0205378 [Drechslerella brochopaga]